jgi:hypothetical protein
MPAFDCSYVIKLYNDRLVVGVTLFVSRFTEFRFDLVIVIAVSKGRRCHNLDYTNNFNTEVVYEKARNVVFIV